ncbi:hypothetical protein ACWT_1941 [Actinoplanes sp. SE50]|uniref:DUF998 domain-containing protein n=1 Tax=unclassified Actinoplanes TaxID=2626549 RepID=UPI00023EC06E|nr:MULTISPECIES: DUF998 domain-containing protein [unclassified Actinoplanes]AEV82960.1 hypothetical protein ACPL_2063 [Actinoplanes sp. SE50/110]ATO81356.1 hypothetical protein ACWT_1941 [Actinoplanes sp. SE50]SLL98763.1 uncharacterized protein ACSP50_1990 [Actinoplanes sp. SE50/110]
MSANLLALIAVILLLTYFAILVALHVRDTRHHPLRDAVSDYGVGPTAGRFRIAVIANSLGILAMTGALADELGLLGFTHSDYVILLLIPITRLALAFFPAGMDSTRTTWTGRIHLILAILSFTFVYLSVAQLTTPLTSFTSDTVGLLLLTLRWLAAFGLAAVVITMLAPALRPFFGLAERIYLATTNLWFLVVALFLTFHR